MVFVGTEDDGLCHGVGGFQVTADFMSYLANSVFHDDIVVVVLIVVDTIFYHITENVALASCRAPLITNICGDVDDLERCQESVVNAFLQAVCVERLVEIADVRLVAGLLGRRRHTQLNGIAEILQNFTPVAVVLGTASMTLINDDHIEELGFEELLVLLFAILSYQLLIE